MLIKTVVSSEKRVSTALRVLNILVHVTIPNCKYKIYRVACYRDKQICSVNTKYHQIY